MGARPKRFTARWVLPVTSAPIRDGAVLVDGSGRIARVGPARTVAAPEDAESFELGEAALLPGLVNVHAHPELTAFRGLLENLPFHLWIQRLVALKRRSGLGPDDYVAAALWCCAESLAAGITTLAATEDSGASLFALKAAGMRGIVYREAFGPDPAEADDALAALIDNVVTMREHESELVRIGVSPHAPYSISDALYRRTAEWARSETLPIAVHAAESPAETSLVRDAVGPFADSLRARGIAVAPRARSPIELLAKTGVLGPDTLVIHAVQLDTEDIRILADSGAAVAHCPIANARLAHGIAPIVELREAGVTVGLGTDSVASNNRLDILEEARAAQLFQRARIRSPEALGPAALLRMATVDGARALGLDDRIGTLEPGKDADLCAVSLDRPHVRPVHDPVAAITLAARGADVVLTAVRGRVLYRNGRFTEMPLLDEVRNRVESAAARLREANSQ